MTKRIICLRCGNPNDIFKYCPNGESEEPCIGATDIRNTSKSYLELLQIVYRKHHLGDETIGWDELSDMLCDKLCNEMGNDNFQEWLKTLKEDK